MAKTFRSFCSIPSSCKVVFFWWVFFLAVWNANNFCKNPYVLQNILLQQSSGHFPCTEKGDEVRIYPRLVWETPAQFFKCLVWKKGKRNFLFWNKKGGNAATKEKRKTLRYFVGRRTITESCKAHGINLDWWAAPCTVQPVVTCLVRTQSKSQGVCPIAGGMEVGSS